MKRCILLAMSLAPFLHGQGLLRNPGFSELTEEGKWPSSWECARGRALYAASNVDGLDSNDSLRYAAEQPGLDCGPVTQSLVCEPNTQYVLLAALKSDGKMRPQVVVTAEGVAGIVARVETDSGAWQRLRAVFNSGAARQFQVGMYGDASIVKSGRSVAGSAGFDAVQIHRADQEPKATAPAVPFAAPGPNIALNKPYTLKPRPGYSYCTDPDDKTQLTDGAYTVGYFWTQKSTVGWSRAYPAIVTIDLGQIEPVAGVSLSTAAGVAGVAWPESAFILLSDDGRNWRMVGDLVGLSTKHGLPLADKYSTHRFATGELKACGRYVQLVVAQSPYCFMDEIEIYRGADEWRALPPQGKPVGDADAFFRETKVLSSIRWRLQADLDAARAAIRDAVLPAAESAALLARAEALGGRVQSLPQEVPESFRTILPLSPLHADIYALNAALLRARGFRGREHLVGVALGSHAAYRCPRSPGQGRGPADRPDARRSPRRGHEPAQRHGCRDGREPAPGGLPGGAADPCARGAVHRYALAHAHRRRAARVRRPMPTATSSASRPVAASRSGSRRRNRPSRWRGSTAAACSSGPGIGPRTCP